MRVCCFDIITPRMKRLQTISPVSVAYRYFLYYFINESIKTAFYHREKRSLFTSVANDNILRSKLDISYEFIGAFLIPALQKGGFINKQKNNSKIEKIYRQLLYLVLLEISLAFQRLQSFLQQNKFT